VPGPLSIIPDSTEVGAFENGAFGDGALESGTFESGTFENSTLDAGALAALAARTFPDACPDWMRQEDIEDFIAENLSRSCFERWLADPEVRVFVARNPESPAPGGYVGYAAVLHGVHADEGPPAWRARRTAYLSKLYVDRDQQGSGLAATLIRTAIEAARDDGCTGLWLGVNGENGRARAFYAKSGLTVMGQREFTVGDVACTDDVFGIDLETSPNHSTAT